MLLMILVLLLARPALAVDFPPVRPGAALTFPRDHGAHPAYRTEWWYLTGMVEGPDGRTLGVQLTFFRSRTGLQEDNPSAFAPAQLLFAHAAIADAATGRLLAEQRSARAGVGLAQVSQADLDVTLGGWFLRRSGQVLLARAQAQAFSLDLQLVPAAPLLAQGRAGFSRKGPVLTQASWYYSWPQLTVRGTLQRAGRSVAVEGRAWLDHEWSSALLDPRAVGWDWLGVNLVDGGALMLFQIRSGDGSRLWAGGAWRDAGGSTRVFQPGEVEFTVRRRWRSPRTRLEYPVALRVRVPGLVLELQPLMDDQELDARASTGTIYWEGLVRALRQGQAGGWGYLELTGYGGRLNL